MYYIIFIMLYYIYYIIQWRTVFYFTYFYLISSDYGQKGCLITYENLYYFSDFIDFPISQSWQLSFLPSDSWCCVYVCVYFSLSKKLNMWLQYIFSIAFQILWLQVKIDFSIFYVHIF